MTDSDSPNKNAIPSWQKQNSDSSTTQNPEDSSKTRKETRMAQARRFLEADEVRNTSTTKQITFLESKGYTPEDISELLGVERNTDASVSETSSTPSPPQSSSNNTSTPSNDPSPPTMQTRQEPQPPIITYPEFLTKPTAPSPLITSTRLLTTLTLFSSLSILLYGSNKYLLAPMQESLTRSRHEFLTQASEHLSTLNAKLGDVVSEHPDTISAYKDQEDEESDGDPTEMFHRDIGIQTSPSLLNTSPSRPTSPSPESSDSSASILEAQLGRLSILSSHLNEINSESTSEGADAAELTTTIDVVRDYLESMAFTPSPYTFGSSAYGGLVRDMVGSAGKEEPDEIAKLKASIRSVKGVLLSAKSFPSSGRGVGMMSGR